MQIFNKNKFKLNPTKFKLSVKRFNFNFKKTLALTMVVALSVLGVFNFTNQNNESKASVGDVTNFSTCGIPQPFTAPEDGTYKLETWGAAANGGTKGGRGGYSTGTVNLKAGQTIYAYVGCKGQTGAASVSTTQYVFGGGAYIHNATGTSDSGGGGGATDFRLTNGNWDNTASLQSRILVAGGGGGNYTSQSATNAGGQDGTMNGGQNGTYTCVAAARGSFGKGGAQSSSDDYGGGGGGWYGGCSSGDKDGGGGSSYAYTLASDKTSYSGNLPSNQFYLTDTNFIAGNASMPDPTAADGTMTGKTNDGYARITQLSTGVVASDPLTIPACQNNPECFAFSIDTRLLEDGSTNGTDTNFYIPISGQVGSNGYSVSRVANWIIDWGDGAIETPGSVTGNISHDGIPHTYSAAGKYQITLRPNGTTSSGWLNAFGFYHNYLGIATQSVNRSKFFSIDTPITELMRWQNATDRFANMFNGAINCIGIPINIFANLSATTSQTSFYNMFDGTFSGVAKYSTTATIPEGLFDWLDTTNGTKFHHMFSGTFAGYAQSSTNGTIPPDLFNSINTNKATTLWDMFGSTFADYAQNSTSATIPADLFDFIDTTNNPNIRGLFAYTFAGYAQNSTNGTIPHGLFSSIGNTINATDFSFMFDHTFYEYAQNSTSATIPADLFDFIDTTNGTDFTAMFQQTFTYYATRTAKFIVDGSQVGSILTYTSPYSVKAGLSGVPSNSPSITAGSQVVPTYNSTTRSIAIPSGYETYTWFYKDGTSCTVADPTPDCGPQDSTTKYTGTWPNTTEWTQTTSTEKGNVTFYGVVIPKITSITPNTGSHTGGQNIKITGQNFTDATSVTIGGNACQSFTINSSTSITCITPAGNVGTADVIVSDDTGTDTLIGGYTYYLGPVINNVSPNTGSSGTDITITGENFGNLIIGPGTPTDFSTCGTPQPFTATETGLYQLEAWGASAGKASRGAGGYTTGTVNLTAGQTIYVYVGCRGTGTGVNTASEVTYVFNGGAYVSSSTTDSGGGGGATDFRITNGDWNDTTSLESRILVAGGGGGGYSANATQPGNQSGSMNGGINGTYTCANTAGTGMGVAGFGVGGARLSSDDYGGGGGGWYGGCSTGDNTGGGGSGYTYTAANATASGIAGPGSQYYLTDTNIIAGNTTIPTPAGGTATGHINSDGYARITPITGSITLDPNGTPADCEITSWTDTEIHCLTSDHTPGLVDIELYNGTDTATKADVFTYLEPTLTLTLDSSNLLLGGSTTTPTPTGTYVSASNTANVITNNVLGYSLSISTDKPSTDTNSSNMEHLSLPGNYLLATTNTCSWNSTTKILTNTTTSLSNNTWGFTLNNTNLTNQQLCKVPNQTSPLTIKQTTTPTDQDTGDDTTIFYGSKIDTNQVAGQYEARVLYTGVVNI